MGIKNNRNGEWGEMKECEDEGLSLTSKIIGDDEDKLKSDDLYSDEDLALHSLGSLSCDPIKAMIERTIWE